jgi:DNA-binding winged helix-turn-helix (wHTH) protein
MNRLLIINDVFRVDTARQVITANSVETRVEPRILAVLIELCQHQGRVVYRTDLIEKIWNNYGGADEGLSQAISQIRKILQDENKQVIETIPKKGYVFHGSVRIEEPPAGQQVERNQTLPFGRKHLVAMVVVIVLLVAAVSTKLFRPEKNKFVRYDQLDTLIENYYNTAITITPDSVRYKLVVIGDQRPLLYINDSLLTPRQMEEHLTMVNLLKKELQNRNDSKD